MHLFRYDSVGAAATKFQDATPIREYDRVMWVERYLEAGEFEIAAPLGSETRKVLPIGTFISHQDTYEIMVVENQEITDNDDGVSEVTITGRSLETLLQNRIVGTNTVFPEVNAVTGRLTDVYGVLSAGLPIQITDLIEQHIYTPNLEDTGDDLADIRPLTALLGVEPPVYRVVAKQDLYSAVLELLKIENLGVQTIRPGTWAHTAAFAGVATNAIIEIHAGIDRRATVLFSYDRGDVATGQYLISNKNLKTSALVLGKWYEKMIHGPETGFDRRVMVVEATDVDENYDETTYAANRELILNNLETRGRQALAAQKLIEIEQIELHRGAQRYNYRKDYNIGDLVTVLGNYGASSSMRVTEHVEIEDETGAQSYPTLAAI